MKLLNCTECHDLKKLQGEWRTCACRKSAARYLRDGRSASVWGHARVVGLDNREYAKMHRGRSFRPSLFLIPESDPRVQRVKHME